MGLREFSMQPGLLLAAKQVIRECRVGELAGRVDRLMQGLDEADLSSVLQDLAPA